MKTILTKLVIVLILLNAAVTVFAFEKNLVIQNYLKEEVKIPKVKYDYYYQRYSVPGLLVKNNEILDESSKVTYLKKELMNSWFEFYKKINFYDKDSINSIRDEIKYMYEWGNLYFQFDLKANKKFINDIKIENARIFLLNDRGKIVDATNIITGDKFSLVSRDIQKYVVVFDHKKIRELRRGRFLKNSKYLKLYFAYEDSIYMFRFDL